MSRVEANYAHNHEAGRGAIMFPTTYRYCKCPCATSLHQCSLPSDFRTKCSDHQEFTNTYQDDEARQYHPLPELVYPPCVERLHPRRDCTRVCKHYELAEARHSLIVETIGRAVNVQPGNSRLLGRPHPETRTCHPWLAATILWKSSRRKIRYTEA